MHRSNTYLFAKQVSADELKQRLVQLSNVLIDLRRELKDEGLYLDREIEVRQEIEEIIAEKKRLHTAIQQCSEKGHQTRLNNAKKNYLKGGKLPGWMYS